MTALVTFFYYAIRMGTPLLLGTTGEAITEKSGHLNLGVEGMMAMGAIGGYIAACRSGSLVIGLLAAFASAAAGALIYAFLTVTMQANQNVTGLALTIFGNGVYLFVGRYLTSRESFPLLSDAGNLREVIADRGIPVLRDIPYLGRLLFSYNIFVYLAIVIAVVCFAYLARTRAGLRMRATGENPAAADASGVNVNLVKYINIVLGGGICGLGGLYLGLVTNGGSWNENWIGGMGWISVALVIFANWNPLIAIFGSFFFGMFNALQAWKGNLSDAFPAVFGWLGSIPNEFYQLLPFLITAIVLAASSMSKKNKNSQPGALGFNYFREER